MNFMPYKGEQEIEFPDNDRQNVMLVFGDNMRGKTSFLNSIRWAFYGCAFGRHLREIARVNLVNREAAAAGDWSMSVEIDFRHGGIDYVLTRTLSKRSNAIVPKADADFDEDLWLKKNGSPIESDIVFREINSIMPQDVSRFFLFDGELLQEYENLLLENDDQGEKIKSHIESVLGVPALINGKRDVQLLLADTRKEQRKQAKNNKELKSLASDQEQLEEAQNSLKNDIADLESKREELQQRVDEIDDFLSGTEAVQKKKSRMEQLKSKQNDLEKELDKCDHSISALIKNAWKDVLAKLASDKLETLHHERDQIQEHLQLTIGLDTQINGITASIQKGKRCDTCGQKIPDQNLETLRNKLAELVTKRDNLGTVEIDNLSQLNDVINQLGSIKSDGEITRIAERSSDKTKARLELIKVESELDELWEEIKGEDTDTIAEQRKDRDQKLRLIGKFDGDLRDQNDRMKLNLAEQVRLSELMSRMGGDGANSVVNAKLKRLWALEKLFDLGIAELREKLKQDIQSEATRTFKKLSTEKSYSSLLINESYGLSILDADGEILPERSAGAEQVVALSLIDGLNKTSSTEAPIVMDTPFGRLDPKHRENILKHLPTMSKQIVLLVHEGEIDPDKDIGVISNKIGARYEIKRRSASHSEFRRM